MPRIAVDHTDKMSKLLKKHNNLITIPQIVAGLGISRPTAEKQVAAFKLKESKREARLIYYIPSAATEKMWNKQKKTAGTNSSSKPTKASPANAVTSTPAPTSPTVASPTVVVAEIMPNQALELEKELIKAAALHAVMSARYTAALINK